MVQYEKYFPVVITALTILVVGCLNPKALQSTSTDGRPLGYPNYLWLAILALVIGGLSVYLYNYK